MVGDQLKPEYDMILGRVERTCWFYRLRGIDR
jgi:hypothetical protein